MKDNNDLIEVETIEINNKEYIIVDKIKKENITYYYMSNYDKPEDILINKTVDYNDELIDVDKDEYKEAMELYIK